MVDIDYIIRNKVSEAKFEDIVEEWLSDGDYTPDDIIENIITQQNEKPLPAHFYIARYNGVAYAKLGKDRTVYYKEYNTATKNYETKSRTVTDWHDHRQNVSGEVSACEYVGDIQLGGLSDFIDRTNWTNYDYQKVSQSASNISSLASLFKLNKQSAWEAKAGPRCDNKATWQIRASLPSSDHVKNFSKNISFDVHTCYSIVLPFWLYTYDYNDKTYYVLVDGSDSSRVHGERPINKKRRNTVRAIRWIGWPGGICASYFVASTFAASENYNNGNGDMKTIGLFVLCFAITWIVVEGLVNMIKNKSKKTRKAKLEQRKKLKNIN